MKIVYRMGTAEEYGFLDSYNNLKCLVSAYATANKLISGNDFIAETVQRLKKNGISMHAIHSNYSMEITYFILDDFILIEDGRKNKKKENEVIKRRA
jgi:hypothetical protein